MRELQEAGISQEHFPILQECATKVFFSHILDLVINNVLCLILFYFIFWKAIEASSDSELEIAHLSSMAAATLEGTSNILFTTYLTA